MLEERTKGLPASATPLPHLHLPALSRADPAQPSLLGTAAHTAQGCKQGLPAQIRIPYLGRAGGEAENPHDNDANNCKKQQGNGQDDPEGPGGSWEVCCGPPVLGARAKEGEQELKLILLPILLHQTRFQLITQILVQTGWSAELPDHCSTWDNETFIPQCWNSRSSILVTSSATASKAAKPPGQGWSSSFPDTGNNKLNYFGLQQKSPAGPSALESDPASVPLPVLGCAGFSG